MILRRPKTLVTAVVLFLLAGSFVGSSHAQIRDAVQVTPRVTLNVSPASLTPGSRVTFAAQLSSGYPNIRFRFDFGDGAQTGWQSSAVTSHTYHSAGNYRPFVDIGVASGSGITRLGGSVRRLVQVTHAPVGPVDLSLNPATAEIGRPVTLSVRSASNNPNIRYRFRFGDSKEVGGWQSNPQASHVYTTSGTYIASVDVALVTNRGVQLQGSSRRGVSVSTPASTKAGRSTDVKKNRRENRPAAAVATTSEPKSRPPDKQITSVVKPKTAEPAPTATPAPSFSPPDTSGQSSDAAGTVGTSDNRIYLWLLLPIALLAVILGKWFFGKPEVRSHVDPGSASVIDEKRLVTNAQVVSPGGASEVEREVTSGEPLVKNVRRENG